MKVPKQVAPGQAVKAETINELIESVQKLKDRSMVAEVTGNDNTITPHAFWADMEWIDPLLPVNAGDDLQVVFTQAYLQNLGGDEKIPVFRHPLEQVKRAREDDEFELILYTSGGAVTAVRFVRTAREGETQEDDFDLQQIADELTAEGLGVPADLTTAITDAEADDLSGEKVRIKVVVFRREDDVGQDELPEEERVQHWEVDYWCKNDVLWGGAGGGACVPWEPTMVDEHDYVAAPGGGPDYKVYLNPGTVNGVIAAEWNTAINLPADYETTMYYILATVSLTDGQVTAIDYSLVSTIPLGDLLNPVGVDALPTALTIILGTTFNLVSCMLWTSNLFIEPVDIYHDEKPNPNPGEVPYEAWYVYRTNGV